MSQITKKSTVGHKYFFLLILLVLSSSINITLAQNSSNKGVDFWLGFMKHTKGTAAGMSLYLTSDSTTTGSVKVPGKSWSKSFSITANSVTVVTIPSNIAYNGCDDCKSNTGVQVTSAKKIVVYAHHYEGNRSDATLVLPAKASGKKFIVMGARQERSSGRNLFIIVASKNNTKINITPSTNLRSNTGGTLAAGTKYQITLNKGQVYQAIARNGGTSDDVSGTLIDVIDTGATANCRTVSVFAGSTYNSIGGCGGFGVTSGDNLFEQMFPVSSWGKSFVLVPAKGRKSDNFRFLASEDNTQITVFKFGGAPDVYNLNAGKYATLNSLSTVRAVIANKPISVAQYQKTAKCDGGFNRQGDPSTTILNPLEQTLTDITLYSSQFYDIDNHYINIVIPSTATTGFKLDGSSVSFTKVPAFGTYSYARVKVSKGNHRLKASTGFIATAYGEGEWESYGYAAGANIKDLTATIEVANSVKEVVDDKATNCLGLPTKFKGAAEYSVKKWEWFFGDGNKSTDKNPTHIYKDTGLYTVKLYTHKSAYDGCSVYDSTFFQVEVFAPPIARFVSTPKCSKNNVTYQDSSIIPPKEKLKTLTWIFHDNKRKYTSKTSKYYDTTGKFFLRLIVETKNGCLDTITDSITISPNPISNYITKDACYKDSTYFLDKSTIPTGAIIGYKWIMGDLDTVYSLNPNHFYNTAGKYIIKYTTTSDSGCTNTYIDSTYKKEQITSSFKYKDTCLGFNSIFTNTSTLNGGKYTDTTWFTSDKDTFHTFDLDKTFSKSGQYQVTLVMEQDSLCTDTATVSINVHPQIDVKFNLTELCFGDSTSFIDKSTLSQGTYTVSWDFDDGIASTKKTGKIKYSTFGVKDVKLTAQSDKGCKQELTKKYTITKPEITKLNVSNQCLNSVQTIEAILVSGLDSFSTYDWQINGVSLSTDSLFKYTATTSGKKIVDIIITTKNGCTIMAKDSFNAIESPKVNFTVANVCLKELLKPVNTSTTAAPSVITNQFWYKNDIQVSTDANPSIITSNDLKTNIKLVVHNNEGCKDSLTKEVTVYSNPSLRFSILDSCFNGPIKFTENSTINNGTILSRKWTIEGTNYTSLSPSHTFSAVGSYTVKLLNISDFGCKDSLQKTVEIFPLPSIKIAEDKFNGCVPFTPSITNNSDISTGTISKTVWNWGDGSISNGASSSHTYNTTGTFTIKVAMQSDKGCKDSLTLTNSIQVFDPPQADFDFNPKDPSVLNSKVDLEDNSSNDVTIWQWSVDNQIYTSKNANHSFSDSGLFNIELIVENNNGCKDSITKSVYVNADLFIYVPSVFSPNGDGINDFFGLEGLTQGVVSFKMEIYNRWGELIFLSTDVNDKWDGTYLKKESPEGTYLIVTSYTNPKQTEWFYDKYILNLVR